MPSNPIIIGGENRSGTTLIGLMLDSHPDVVVGSEIDFVSPSLENLGHGALGEAERRFLRQTERFGISRGELMRLLLEESTRLGHTPLSFQERCRFMAVLGQHRAEMGGSDRWGFQVQRWLAIAELMQLAWPQAKFVHVVRDGRDVAASHLRLEGKAWAYRSAEEAAIGWSRLVHQIADLSCPVIAVRYEDIVRAPAPTMRQLLQDLNLRWSESVLHHDQGQHDLFALPHNHPSASQAQRALNTDSIGSYRTRLSDQEVKAFELIAGDALAFFGYI